MNKYYAGRYTDDFELSAKIAAPISLMGAIKTRIVSSQSTGDSETICNNIVPILKTRYFKALLGALYYKGIHYSKVMIKQKMIGNGVFFEAQRSAGSTTIVSLLMKIWCIYSVISA